MSRGCHMQGFCIQQDIELNIPRSFYRNPIVLPIVPWTYNNTYVNINFKRSLFNMIEHCDITEVKFYLETQHNKSLDCNVKEDASLMDFIPPEETVDSRDVKGNTPLHCAVKTQIPDIVRIIIMYRPNVNALNHQNQSPLQCACMLSLIHI